MRTEVRAKGLSMTDELRDATLRRIDFALGRFSSSIRMVDIHIANENTPSHATRDAALAQAYRCQITVRFAEGGEVLISDVDSRLRAGIHRATERVARRVKRHLGKRRNTSTRPLRLVEALQ
jgi:ribosomal subunit interface protein